MGFCFITTGLKQTEVIVAEIKERNGGNCK
jgi:hypothetical protein